jgi:hypothetical protein
MTLINAPASLPSYMWAVVRLLLASNGSADEKAAKLMLTPPTLPAGETDEFDDAVRSLAELGIVAKAEGVVELAEAVRGLRPNDVAGFNGLLRRAALDPARNGGLAESDGLEGPKDLVRALAWFLTQDPVISLDWDEVGELQDRTFPRHLPPPFANNFRWGRFVYWAPALGFGAQPLLDEGGAVRLVPDCTVAVRETVLALWKKGQSVSPGEAVDSIIAELPVLPGGAYSRSLGLAAPDGDEVSVSLSNAILTGAEAGWIKFDDKSDAGDVTFLVDAGGTRVGVSNFTINGSE